MFSNRHHTEETKAKLRITQLGRHHTEETKAKMSKSHLGKGIGKGRPHTIEARAKMSLTHTGTHRPEEVKIKMSHSLRIALSRPEVKANLRRAMKILWQTPEYRDKKVKQWCLANRIKPTKPEQQLLKLLETNYPNEWNYVGNGQLIIAGKNPDFANVNGKKQLIELFGDYWHAGENPQERIGLFGQYGFKCLVIWEHELEQPQEVLKRIADFTTIKKKEDRNERHL